MGLQLLDHRRWVRAGLLVLGLAVLYLCGDLALNRFAFFNGWTILWPLNGITIALLLMSGRRDWPAMLLGVALGTGMGEYREGSPAGFEVWERAISLTEVFLSAWCLPQFENFERWLRRPLIAYRYMAALLVGPGVSGVLAAVLYHLARGQRYSLAFSNWALADALGIAVTMPLVLALRSPEMWRLFRGRQLAQTMAVLALAAGVSEMIFLVSRYSLLFLLFPLLLLVESLLGFSGAALAVFGIALLAVYSTTHGYGPFGVWPAGLALRRDTALQFYLGFNLIALFPALVVSMERRRISEELVRSNEQLTKLASIDGLTGILNRRSLDEVFLKEWKRALRLHTPLALLMVDIDHFKQYNDRYGHHAGDLCLKAVADALSCNLQRSSDTVARFGGEEFALLLPHTTLRDACEMAEKIRTSMLALGIQHDRSPFGSITVSIGCAAAVPHNGTLHLDLLQEADSALYVAKHVGRNCVQLSPETALTDGCAGILADAASPLVPL